MNKENFIAKAIDTGTTLANLLSLAGDLHKAYFDKGLNSGGSNELIQEDLDSHGIALGDFTALVTCLEQLTNFATNQAVIQGDHKATLNKIRNDW